MNPVLQQQFSCEHCLRVMHNTKVILGEEVILLLCCPSMECLLGGHVKVCFPASLSAPSATEIAEFIIPGSGAYMHKTYTEAKQRGGAAVYSAREERR